MNETELLQAFRDDRSEAAFAELVRRYAGLVYSVAKRRLANGSLAEDITQIVFIRLAKAPPHLRTPAELAAWLHRTTVHVTIDTWRSESRRRNREQQAELMEPAENFVWEEITPQLDEALNQLNDEDRQAVLLRFFGRKTMRETGVALGVSEDAAKMRVSRAVDKLRTQLGAGAACTVAVLATVLTERSAEAAPAHLVARLAEIKLGAMAGASGQGATALSRFTVVTGGVVLLILVAGLVYMTHSKAAPTSTTVAAQTNPVVAAVKTVTPAVSNASNNSSPAPPVTKPVKLWFNVIDAETGLGLPGAKIHVASFGAGGMGEGLELLTDSNGTVAILEPDDSGKSQAMNVFVVAEGYVSKAVSFESNYLLPQYNLMLERATTAGGVVVDEEGSPVAGVKIMLQGPGKEAGQMENLDFQTCPVTNREDGSWSFGYLPREFTNEIRFTLKKSGYAVTEPVIPVSRVNLTNLVLVIERGYTVMGQVTDNQGQPLAKARIKTLDGWSVSNQSARTDVGGNFVLTGVTADDRSEVNLAIQAKGFASQTTVVTLNGLTNFVNFTLTNGNVFRGRIVDEAGRPITNAIARIDADFVHQIPNHYDWLSHVDETGEFNWDSAPSETICYWFEADGYVPIRGMPLAADGTEHQITLQKIK